MTTVLSPPNTRDIRVVLPNVSWKTYEHLLKDLADCSSRRLTYDKGELEIMSPTARHEKINRAIERFVVLAASELRIAVDSLGSTTFKREDIAQGFEPASCFYLTNEPLIWGKHEIDLATDPPPDLVVEIDMTSSSLNKQAIFAHFGVPEIWRCNGDRVEIRKLVDGIYVDCDHSLILPAVTPEVLLKFIDECFNLDPLEFTDSVRDWARKQKAEK